MALSLPPRDTLPGIGVVRQEEEQPRPPAGPSLGCDSELDGVLPTALVLETAASCSQGSSPHVLELPRKSTSSNNTPARVEDPDKNADAGPIELDAQNVVARPPSRPASSRRTAAGVKPKEHISIARKVTRILLGLDRGARSASCDAGVSWKPHEKLLKALDYRPRGHGRPFTEKYTLGDTLGTGGFGVVRDGTHRPDGEVFAVKVMSRDAFADADVEALAREVDILRRLDHQQVVRFIDFYEEPQTFFLVLEKVPGGELFERIIAEGRFMEGDARDCIRSLLEALEYCHSQQIVHRDIKPENILFANLDATDRTVKLCDFGLARSLAEGPVGGDPCGTPTYMAPESLKMTPHGTPVDCWGVGVVTHILLVGYAPFASSRIEKLFRLIKKGRISFEDECWSSVSQNAKDFVSALLRVDPDARPTTGHALQHAWLTEAAESTDSDGQELARSLVKLKVFNAKQKFRAAIHAFVACQQLQGWLSSTEITDAKPLSTVEVEKPKSTERKRWTFQKRNNTGTHTTQNSAQPPPEEHEKRRFTSRPILPRKLTGMFKDEDWRRRIVTTRESCVHRGLHEKAGEGAGLLGGNAIVKDLAVLVAGRRAEEQLAEGEEINSSSSEDGHDLKANLDH